MPNFTKFNQAFNPSDVQQFFHYDEAEDKSVIYQTQDVEPILKMNKIERNHIDQSNDVMKHVACIPRIVDKNDWPKIKQKLNSNEFQYFRTHYGEI